MTNTPRQRRIKRLRRTAAGTNVAFCIVAVPAILLIEQRPDIAAGLIAIALGLFAATLALTWKKATLIEQEMATPLLGVVLPKEDA